MSHCSYLAHGLAVCAVLLAPVLSANTVDCEAIAAETVLELEAGAAQWWSEDTARMAGMAAASACFKTQADIRQSNNDEEPEPSDPDEEAAAFMGLEVRPLSGPPSRKPYERTRD